MKEDKSGAASRLPFDRWAKQAPRRKKSALIRRLEKEKEEREFPTEPSYEEEHYGSH